MKIACAYATSVCGGVLIGMAMGCIPSNPVVVGAASTGVLYGFMTYLDILNQENW